MKAAVLNALGAPLAIETLPDPAAGPGDIVVDVAAAGVAGYAARVFSGSRNYLLETPIAPGPGGVGRVRAVGPDATRLKPGDWVYCDSTIRSRDDALTPDTILLGWTARSAAALPLHRLFHHGTYAEQVRMPAESVTSIGEIAPADAGRWCALSRLLVPYGGLLAGELRAGETLVINGATGGFGGAGVIAALAMGAGRVVATGRNAAALEALERRLGPRVRPARMTGDEAEDAARIRAAADGAIDMVLDFLPREASAHQVRAAATTVRWGGRVVLMGGVGRAGGEDLSLPYSWFVHNDVAVRGKWMYPREAVPGMIALVRAGLVDLDVFDRTEFPLAEANAAIAFAAETAGPLQHTVIRPDAA